MDSETFALVQRALAEPKRVEILEIIRRANVCPTVTEAGGVACSVILNETDISQATFSHHVTELTKAGLISAKKEGRCNLIRIDEAVVNDYLNELRKKMLG